MAKRRDRHLAKNRPAIGRFFCIDYTTNETNAAKAKGTDSRHANSSAAHRVGRGPGAVFPKTAVEDWRFISALTTF